MRMKNTSLLLFLLLSLSLFSQIKPIIISGYVVDSISQEPKSNINIMSVNNSNGLISDEDGLFEILLSKLPDTLKFSFVGYNTKAIFISNAMDTNLVVELVPKVYILNEVAVFSDNNTYNAQIYNYSILDYGFTGDSMLILQKRRSLGGNPSLVLLNRDYDTIAYRDDLPADSKRLFRDCIGSYHILTSDSAYQVNMVDGSFSLLAPYDKVWFYQVLGDCIFKKDDNLFFEFPIYDGYGHEIIYVNHKHEKNLFVKYVDLERFSSLNQDISDVSKDYYMHSDVRASTNDSLTIVHTRHFDAMARYVRDFENIPIKNNICLFQDTIFYFNFFESKIQCFSDLINPPSELNLVGDKTSGWEGELIIDQIENKVYSIEKNKAYYYIYLVDMEKGQFDYQTRVSVFKGENLAINNGFIYYLTNPSLSRNSITKLSRIKLGD